MIQPWPRVFPRFYGNKPKAAVIDDLFPSFTLTRAGLLTLTISTSGVKPVDDIDFGTVEILGPGGAAILVPITLLAITGTINGMASTNLDGRENGAISGIAVGSGKYFIHVTGTGFGPTGSGSYAGTVSFLPTSAPDPTPVPVPDPPVPGPDPVPIPDPVPVPDPAPVPEPATWAMLIIGFFAAGHAMRRRRARQPRCLMPG